MHPNLVEDRRDMIAVLRIDREPQLGALSRGMVKSLGAYLNELSDSEVRVLILTGTGRGFVAGADIGEYHEASQNSFDSYQHLSRRVFDYLESLPQPTIAAVNGYALGGGFELALCCDFITASTDARFGLPEVSLGLLPGGGGTQRLSRAVGTRVAKELIMTGRHIAAEEANSHRLLTRLVEPKSLMPASLELAATLADRAPLTVREAKQVINQGVQIPLAPALTLEQRVLSGLFATSDAKEGIRAFVEKRQATFTGR